MTSLQWDRDRSNVCSIHCTFIAYHTPLSQTLPLAIHIPPVDWFISPSVSIYLGLNGLTHNWDNNRHCQETSNFCCPAGAYQPDYVIGLGQRWAPVSIPAWPPGLLWCQLACGRVQAATPLIPNDIQTSGYLTGMIQGLHPVNERRRYKVTPSVIGWAQT